MLTYEKNQINTIFIFEYTYISQWLAFTKFQRTADYSILQI